MRTASGSPPHTPRPTAPSNESQLRRLRRRLVTIPLVFVATLLSVALLPLLLVFLGLVDLLRRRLVFTRGLLFLVGFLLFESVAICGITLLWVIQLFYRNRDWFERANRTAQTLFTTGLYRMGEHLFSLRTHSEGTLPPTGPNAPPLLVFIRHCSTADTVLPVLLLAPLGYRLRYVLKRELLLDPCLDIVGLRLRNYFVARGGKETEEDLRGVLDLAADLSQRDALVIYPEGTRFSPTKRARILERLQKHGPPDSYALAASLTHTLPPLQRGPLELLRTNPSADLLLIGHVGLDAAGSLAELLRGDLFGQTVRIITEHIPFAQLPTDPVEQRAFLAAKWREIDAFVGTFRKTE